MQQRPGPQGPRAAPVPVTARGTGDAAGAGLPEAGARGEIPCLLAGCLDLHLSPPAGLCPLLEAVEVHHDWVERKSFVFSKLRKQLQKQSPQNNPKQGWVYSAYEFLRLLGSECDFSTLN